MRAFSKREVREFYRRLAETRPIPQTELEFISPFTLLVASHGRSLVIGDIVTPAVRRELAASIREALKCWRDTLNPAGAATP